MDPLEVGADGCGLNGGGDAEVGNLSDGGSGVATEARMQCMEPKGLTLWFYRSDGCEETHRPPGSPCLPRPVTTSRRGARAHNLWPSP